jgi:hypothetical protein
MIVVNLQLWPHGLRNRQESLGRFEIVNDGSGTQERGNYKVTFFARNGRRLKIVQIKDWPRQTKSVFQLLLRVMEEAYGKGSEEHAGTYQFE